MLAGKDHAGGCMLPPFRGASNALSTLEREDLLYWTMKYPAELSLDNKPCGCWDAHILATESPDNTYLKS